MLKTLVCQCRIHLRAKCTLKIYDQFKLLLDCMIESLFLFFPRHAESFSLTFKYNFSLGVVSIILHCVPQSLF